MTSVDAFIVKGERMAPLFDQIIHFAQSGRDA